MARKTFISYKYSEATDLRDAIIKALGTDATFYQGETSDSPDMTDLQTSTIKKNLTDMMFNTSVLIVIISPNMKQSKWIDWEIEYCLQNNTRKDRTSQTNGVVGVIKKVNGNCNWLIEHAINAHGNNVIRYRHDYLYPIISKNMFNSNPAKVHCDQCKTFDYMEGSYISLIDEDSFLLRPNKYIEKAFEKSENDASGYKLTKEK